MSTIDNQIINLDQISSEGYLESNFTVANGETLIIDSELTLSEGIILTNNGQIINNSIIKLEKNSEIRNKGTFGNIGSINSNQTSNFNAYINNFGSFINKGGC